ncbi:hypothetical protein [Natrinema sp. DC36]|uniref:hypothetical protein n=1 Tax=Natrinema sp. DC36 TaxID=2878680 RepID=UPI001CF05735|nr:hypothetical protein [Natrinema sp. DC36]
MTTRDDTNARSDNSGVQTDSDAQDVLDCLRRNGGRERRQRILYATQLPQTLLDDVLLDLEAAGYIVIVPSYAGDRVILTELVDSETIKSIAGWR